MRKIIVTVTVLASGLVGLFMAAGRGATELKGYVRASADTAVDSVTEALPEEVHDKKLLQELINVKAELVDRAVATNLSKRKRDELEAEVTNLEGSTARRQRLLAEAYPVLKTAIEMNQASVTWTNQKILLAAFQKNVDELLAVQEREKLQLEIKRTGLSRLQKCAAEGEEALAEMKRGLEQTEQAVAILRSRRDQAEVESSSLDLISTATANRETVATSLNRGVERLKGNVDKLEARNEARRGTASITERQSSNPISRAFNRLESLKAIHEATPAQAPTTSESKPTASSTKTLEASKVVIEIQGSNVKKPDCQ